METEQAKARISDLRTFIEVCTSEANKLGQYKDTRITALIRCLNNKAAALRECIELSGVTGADTKQDEAYYRACAVTIATLQANYTPGAVKSGI